MVQAMKWNDVTEEKQSEWLASDVTQAFLRRIDEEASNSRDGVAGFVREGIDNALCLSARKVGEMDAFTKVRRIAEDKR